MQSMTPSKIAKAYGIPPGSTATIVNFMRSEGVKPTEAPYGRGVIRLYPAEAVEAKKPVFEQYLRDRKNRLSAAKKKAGQEAGINNLTHNHRSPVIARLEAIEAKLDRLLTVWGCNGSANL